MPALVFLGRRCRVGSDDFYYPVLVSIFYQVPLLLVCLLYLFWFQSCSTYDWGQSGIVFWYMLGAALELVLLLAVELAILRISAFGSIIQLSKRATFIPPLLLTHFAFSVLEFALVGLGAFFYGKHFTSSGEDDTSLCHPDAHFVLGTSTALGLDVISSILMACFAVGGASPYQEPSFDVDVDSIGKNLISERQSLLHHSDDEETERDSMISSGSGILKPHQLVWTKRCNRCCCFAQCITCNLFGGSNHNGTAGNDPMAIVANLIARFFYGSPDLVVSDIVAGFVLLSAVQAYESAVTADYELSHQESSRSIPPTPVQIALEENKQEEEKFLEPSCPLSLPILLEEKDDCDTSAPPHSAPVAQFINKNQSIDSSHEASEVHENTSRVCLEESVLNLAYFSKYAIGIYGWMLYIWSHPWTGIFKLMFSCCKNKASYIVGDNFFHLHQTALQLETGVSSQDIVYASFHNLICQPAFCVLMDHVKQKVVIAIRGTLSFEDCLTDAIAHGYSIKEDVGKWQIDCNPNEEVYAHQGMFHCADWIRGELEELGVLDNIFHADEVSHSENIMSNRRKVIFEDQSLPDVSHYGLVVTGHSLGAGTATILSLMLKNRFSFVQCCAFSPPGCVLSKNLAKLTESFVTSCVVGKDIIARTSLLSIQKLRDKVLDLIARSKVNKSVILRQVITWHSPEELLYPEGYEVESHFGKELKNYRSLLDRIDAMEPIPEMFPPGRIVHLTRPSEDTVNGCWVCCRPGSGGVCCTTRSDYEPNWSTCQDFTEIRVSRTMLDDHFPDKVHHVLQDLSHRLKAQKRN